MASWPRKVLLMRDIKLILEGLVFFLRECMGGDLTIVNVEFDFGLIMYHVGVFFGWGGLKTYPTGCV